MFHDVTLPAAMDAASAVACVQCLGARLARHTTHLRVHSSLAYTVSRLLEVVPLASSPHWHVRALTVTGLVGYSLVDLSRLLASWPSLQYIAIHGTPEDCKLPVTLDKPAAVAAFRGQHADRVQLVLSGFASPAVPTTEEEQQRAELEAAVSARAAVFSQLLATSFQDADGMGVTEDELRGIGGFVTSIGALPFESGCWFRSQLTRDANLFDLRVTPDGQSDSDA